MSVAIVTMVYNDSFFLDLWLKYYERYFPRHDIHVICHGPQAYVEASAQGCNIAVCPRDPLSRSLDRDRFTFIGKYCSALLDSHDRVIYNDVDELIMLDPQQGDDLSGYIHGIPPDIRVISPIGLEMIHRTDLEGDYDYGRAVLTQRQFVRMTGQYTKPNIFNKQLSFGPDGHGVSHDQLYLADDLFTMHLKWFDHRFHMARFHERAQMRLKQADGSTVNVGGGTWTWSETLYRSISNRFLALPISDREIRADLHLLRERAQATFQRRGDGHYKVGSFNVNFLHVLPERFVGLV